MKALKDETLSIKELEECLKDVKLIMTDSQLKILTQGILSEIFIQLLASIKKKKK